jgi:hypothetical protein
MLLMMFVLGGTAEAEVRGGREVAEEISALRFFSSSARTNASFFFLELFAFCLLSFAASRFFRARAASPVSS